MVAGDVRGDQAGGRLDPGPLEQAPHHTGEVEQPATGVIGRRQSRDVAAQHRGYRQECGALETRVPRAPMRFPEAAWLFASPADISARSLRKMEPR